MLCRRTLRKVKLSLRLQHSSIIANISDANLENAMQAIRNNQPINNRVRTLLKKLEIIGGDVRGIPQWLNKFYQQMPTRLMPIFGAFNVWITLNIQESSSQMILRIVGEQDVPISYDVPENVPNITWRMQICTENPMAMATFFDIFMHAFLDTLLGLPYGNNDFTSIHRGIFGWIQAYMFILEVSNKVTEPHVHGLLKIQGLDHNKLIDRIHNPIFTNIYKSYLLNTFMQDLLNNTFDVEPPKGPDKQNDLI